MDVSFGLRYSNCIVGTVYCRRCEVFHFSLLMFSMVKLLMEEILHLKNLQDLQILQPSQVVQDFFDQECLDHFSPNLQPANLANEK